MNRLPRPTGSRVRFAAAAACAGLFAGVVLAQQTAPGPSIYTCVNVKGQHLRSDRPIPECTDREQRVLNRDGSLQRIQPPGLTLEERAAKDVADRRIAAEKAAKKEAERSDKLLMQRYPSQEAHDKVREAALDVVRYAVRQSEARLRALEVERKPLVDEAEFYKDGQMPPKLKHQFDAIDTTAEAQRVLMLNQQAEIVRINALYDIELARLRKLWAGAEPGSLGPMAAPPVAAAPVTAPMVAKTVGTPRP